MSLALDLYAAASRIAEPLAPALLARRARQGKEDPVRLNERLGRPTRSRPDGALVWLHGVSVGEALSLLPLVEAIRAARPGLSVLVTSGTRTSADLLARRLPEGVIHQYAPVDAPGAVAGFLNHWRPAAALLVESELWPNLILAARSREVRLALVSARMTESSARGWTRAPHAARILLRAFDLILPQDADTARRLTGLGGRMGPALNLKRLAQDLPFDQAELARLKAQLAGRSVILAASTHPGEEALVAEAARGLDAVLVVVPRHPERGGALAGELSALGLPVTRRSLGEAPGTGIHIADTLGELGLWFRLADITVMGGGFLPGVGGHNPLEPARLGAAVITGPSVFNAKDLYQDLLARAAALEAADAEALARHLRGLLAYPHIRRRMGEAAQDYARSQAAAADPALAALWRLLPA